MDYSKMIYTKYARWYCDVVVALGVEERLRLALVIVTPHVRKFIEFMKYKRPHDRLAASAETIVGLYEAEPWHRRPRMIRCGQRGLTELLMRDERVNVPVRTDRTCSRLESARNEFRRWAASVPRRAGWSSGTLVR